MILKWHIFPRNEKLAQEKNLLMLCATLRNYTGDYQELRGGKTGSCLMSTVFQFCKTKKFWRLVSKQCEYN